MIPIVTIPLIVAVTFLLLNPLTFTLLKTRPEGRVGVLFVNPFTLSNHIKTIPSKTNIDRSTFKPSSWKINFSTLDKGYRSMSDTGLRYKCDLGEKSNVVYIDLEKYKINNQAHLLGKRIYFSLLICISEKMTSPNADTINLLSDLVFSQTSSTPVRLF